MKEFIQQYQYLLAAAYLFVIGFLVDQQFNQCKVTERTKWYQPISTTWHYLLFFAMVGSVQEFIKYA